MHRVLAVLAAAVGLVIALPAAPASAHAFLTYSNPADGSVLTSAPDTLRLAFSESVVFSATEIEIVDNAGRRFDPTSLRLVRSGEADDIEEPVQIVATLPALPQSAYRVSWQTLSADDLHVTSGRLAFGINAPVQATPFVEPTPRAEEAALRWALFVCLATALGGPLVAALYRRSGGEPRLLRRCWRLSVGGAAAGAVVAAGLLVDQMLVSGSSVARLLQSSYGQHWALREAGLIVLLAGCLLGLRFAGAPRARRVLIVAGAAGAGLGSALLGHSGSGSGLGPSRWLADSAHLVAAAVWSGLLILALIVVLPQLRRGGGPAESARAVLRGFAGPAAACVSVLVVSGVYLASGVVGSVDAALLTTYGRTLLAKLGVVAVVGVLAVLNTRALHRRGRTPRRTVFAEGVLVLAVLGLAAVLTSGQPAREPQFVSSPMPKTVPVMDTQVADLQESVAVRPNRPGNTIVFVDVLDTRRPAPAPVSRVLVQVGPESGANPPLSAIRDSEGHWSLATDLATPGRTDIRVTVQRLGMPDVTHEYGWVVGGTPVLTREATVSTAPLRDRLEGLALALAVLVALAWGSVLVARTRGADEPAGHPEGVDESAGSDSIPVLAGSG